MVIAVDFDGTLCSDCYPEEGEPNYELAESLRAAQRDGHKLVLWTARHGELLSRAVEYCYSRLNLKFDGVNNRPSPDPDEGKYSEPLGLSRYRKVFADIYVDDRALSPDDFVSVFRKNQK